MSVLHSVNPKDGNIELYIVLSCVVLCCTIDISLFVKKKIKLSLKIMMGNEILKCGLPQGSSLSPLPFIFILLICQIIFYKERDQI